MRGRLLDVVVISLVMLTSTASPVQAKGWLPACWMRFWHGTEKIAEPAHVKHAAAPVSDAKVTSSFRPSAGAWTRCLQTWSRGRRQPSFGLHFVPRKPGARERRTLVVYLHGLNSRPEDLTSLINDAVGAGHACATYRYPNDQPIKQSARQLSNDLRVLHQQRPDLSVVLVTHSMGALVARAAVENAELDPHNIRRLIMIAPPNHGSYLAQYAYSLDIWEYLCSPARRREAGLLAGSVRDGWSEATQDMRPGSRFLRKLNERSRNPRVRYCLVIGTGGPLDPNDFAGAGRLLSSAGRRCRWMDCLDRQFRDRVLAADEFFVGKGDGFVSAKSARLAGVDDVVVGRFAHGEILEDSDDPVVQKMRASILARL